MQVGSTADIAIGLRLLRYCGFSPGLAIFSFKIRIEAIFPTKLAFHPVYGRALETNFLKAVSNLLRDRV